MTDRTSRYFVGRSQGAPFLGIEFAEGRAPIRHSWRDGERIVWVRADQREEVIDLGLAHGGQLALAAFSGQAGLAVVQIELLGTEEIRATSGCGFIVRDRLETLRQQLHARDGQGLARTEGDQDSQRMRGFVGGQTEELGASTSVDSPQMRELLRLARNEADRAGVALTWVSAGRAQPAEVRHEIELRQRAVTLRASGMDERLAHAEWASYPAGAATATPSGVGQQVTQQQAAQQKDGELEGADEAPHGLRRAEALEQLQRDYGLTQEGIERVMAMSGTSTVEPMPYPGEMPALIRRMLREEHLDARPASPRHVGG